MTDLSNFADAISGRPVAVFGLGISGLSVVRALIEAGITVVAWDDKEENQEKAKELGAQIDDLATATLTNFACLVLAPGVPYTYNPHPVVVNAQRHNLEIIGDLELLNRSNHGLKTIGITGTNGKSTTTALLTHVLNKCGMSAVMGGNIGKPVFNLDLPNGYEVLVLEISSYQMDLCPEFRPDISIFLNITPDHLDRHGSMDEYIKAKARILDGNGNAIIAVDDDFTQTLFDNAFCSGARKVYPVSTNNSIIEGLYTRKGILYENTRGEDLKIADLNGLDTLKGIHNHQNILCVFRCCVELGIEPAKILEALKSYGGLAHRQYLVTKIDEVTYINDSKATNAEAAAKALASYDNIFWIIGGRAKENGLRGLSEFKSKIIKTYLIGEASDEFAEWLDKHEMIYERCDVIDNATEKAHFEAQEFGERATVLLSPACASWDQFSSFEKRGDAFMEKVATLEKVIYEHSA